MKILVADDEMRIVDILRKFLQEKGQWVEYALDGPEALKLIKKNDYDIIFLDLNMPEVTGFEILRYCKENHLKAKVVLLTGYPDVTDSFCKKLKADEYLEKPIDLKMIGEIVDKYLLSQGGPSVGKKILVVDDEKRIVDIFFKLLTKEGFTVLTATDGEGCLKAAREEAPDLIVLDIVMPGMDGGDVAMKLWEDEKTKKIPLVFLTGAITKEEVVERYGDMGNHLFLLKSTDISKQIQMIKRTVEGHSGRIT